VHVGRDICNGISGSGHLNGVVNVLSLEIRDRKGIAASSLSMTASPALAGVLNSEVTREMASLSSLLLLVGVGRLVTVLGYFKGRHDESSCWKKGVTGNGV
jgi:hypothetical protein